MATTFTFRIDGLRETLKRIESYDKALAEGVVKELDRGAVNIATRAIINAPKGKTGRLAASIGYNISQPYQKSVYAGAFYSPYVEFGTGLNVFKAKSGFVFTPEMKEFAKEFYVNGMGRMPAQPFLFPAFEYEKPKIIERIKGLFFGAVKVTKAK